MGKQHVTMRTETNNYAFHRGWFRAQMTICFRGPPVSGWCCINVWSFRTETRGFRIRGSALFWSAVKVEMRICDTSRLRLNVRLVAFSVFVKQFNFFFISETVG